MHLLNFVLSGYVATNPDLSCGRDRTISRQQKQTVSAVILKVIYRRFISQPQNGTFGLETLTVASKNRRFISLANLFDEWATVWLRCVCLFEVANSDLSHSVLQQTQKWCQIYHCPVTFFGGVKSSNSNRNPCNLELHVRAKTLPTQISPVFKLVPRIHHWPTESCSIWKWLLCQLCFILIEACFHH